MVVLFVGLAGAHSPHDVSPFVAVGPDGTLFTADTEVLAWTRDGGGTWDYRYLDAGVGVCGTVDAGGFTVGTEDAGVWTSADGATWTTTAGPTRVTACAPGVWAGREGLWIDGVQVLDVPVVDVAGRDAALLADDTVALAPDWTPTAPATEPTAVASDAGVPVVASALGELQRWDGTAWQAVPGSPLGAEVVTVAGSTWLAATAREGVFVSTDGGTSWTQDAVGFETIHDGPGSPADGRHFLDLAIVDGVWYSAQWEGIWWKDPATDDHWRQGSLDTVPRTRGVEWVGEELLGAVYGGGVYRGPPGGDDWRVVSREVGWPYPKQIVQRDDDMYLVSGSILYRSRDAGAHWEDLPLGADDVGDHLVVAPDYPDTPVVLAGARAEGVGGAFVSLDRGDTWTWSPVPGACTEKPAVLATDGTTTWMACGYQGELYRSADWGLSWELVLTLGANIWDLLPEDPPLLAAESGLFRWVDGAAEPIGFEGVQVDQVVRGPDGRRWLTTPGSGVYQLDEDDVATPVGWPLLDRVEDLAISDAGVFAVGTRRGMFTSTDTLTWTRANPVEFHDDGIQSWWFTGDWTTVDGPDWVGTHARTGGVGATAVLSWSGVQVRVWGESETGARVTTRLDGEEAQLELAPDTPYALVVDSAAADGAHVLELVVDGGHLTVDVAEAWRSPAPPMPEDTAVGADPPPCGCGGGEKAAALLLLVPALRRRRSR